MKYYAANAHFSTNTNSTTPSDKKVFWYSDEDSAGGLGTFSRPGVSVPCGMDSTPNTFTT